MRLGILLAVLTTAAAVPATWAGEYNQVLSIGDAAPGWVALPGTDGKKHSLADYKNSDVLVVAFTCASCPTAVDYEERIKELASKYGTPQGRVSVIAVCVNNVPQDTLDALTKRAAAQKFNFDLLHDQSQKIAKDFGAIFTPEFYVFNKDRKLVYMGALDDQSDASKVQKRFVVDAIEATLKGEAPAVKETIARGCRVRYARERK